MWKNPRTVGQDVYRASTLPAPIEPPPRELVYVATNHERKGIHFAWMQLFVLPIVLGIGVAVFIGNPWLALIAMVVAFVFAYRMRNSSMSAQGAVLRVEEGELRVFTRSSSVALGKLRASRGACKPARALAQIKLRDLTDVRLDIKTIERVQEGDSMIAAVRFTNTTVGPKVDHARIVLVGRKTKKNPDRLRVHLTDEWFAHMDATEWMGKIRVFLRKNGWVPADERKKDKDKDKDKDKAPDLHAPTEEAD